MPSDGPSVLECFLRIDALLAAEKGNHASSPTWKEAVADYLLSGKRRMVTRKGRQGGGSTTMERLAPAIAIGGEHRLPPGTRGEIAFFSVRLRDANDRLLGLEHVLHAIGVRFKRSGDAIELAELPIVFRSVSATTGAARGATRLAIFEDELCHWRNDDDGSNPAAEVDAAATPSLITQPNGRVISLSSPLGSLDFHAELFARGNTDDQRVYTGPSWYWNPAISEADTHALQTDAKRWAREFAAVPQEGATSALDADEVRRCLRRVRAGHRLGAPVICMDASGGRGDSYTWCTAVFWQAEASIEHEIQLTPEGFERVVLDANGNPKTKAFEATEPEICFGRIRAVTGKFSSHTTSADIIQRIVADARAVGAKHVVSDPFNSFPNASAFASHGLALIVNQWTSETKAQALARMRQWLRDSTMVIEPSANGTAMVGELIGLQEVIRPTGTIGLGARRGSHDDLCALALNAAMFDITGGFSGSPIKTSHRIYSGYETQHPNQT